MKAEFKILLSSIYIFFCVVNCFSQVSFHKNDTTSQLHNINRRQDYDFQDADISYYAGKTIAEIDSTNAFLRSQGIPYSIKVAIPNSYNWQNWDKKYLKFKEENPNHKYINLYKRITSSYILRNHALLADVNQKGKIAFYTLEYLESCGQDAGMIYYCMQALENYWDKKIITKLIIEVLPLAEQKINQLAKEINIETKSELDKINKDMFIEVYNREMRYITKLKKIIE